MSLQFLHVFAASLCFSYVNSAGGKVPLTVYYESLCPDSQKFFTTQLYPLLQTNMSNYVNLTLVPYGKSNQTEVSSGEWTFTCHHGPSECQGNKIQACALNVIEQSMPMPPNAGFNPVTVTFINCLMNDTTKTIDPTTGATTYNFPVAECAKIANVPQYATIENCANHVDGSRYLAALGKQTSDFQPKLLSVPTVVLNDRYDKQESAAAVNFLSQILCKYVPEPLEECHNGGYVFNVSLLLVALSLLNLL